MGPAVLAIVKQPFHYLDRGSQSYVFESQDKQYVIKFFRFDSKPLAYRVFLNSLLGQKLPQNDLKIKTELLFKACKLAYERVPKETGLVFIHLNETEKNLPVLHCKDAIGRSYHLPLDKYRFVIQRKAELLTEVLEKQFKSGNREEIEKSFDAYFDLIHTRTAQAIHNADPNLSRNIGFLDGKAIEIDFGCYRDGSGLDPVQQQLREMRRSCNQLRSWLKGRAPEWIPYVERHRKEYLEQKEMQEGK